MTDPAREEERRELERRAFGKDGSGLNEADAARLAELRGASVPVRAERDEGLVGSDPAAVPESREETTPRGPRASTASASVARLAPDPERAERDERRPEPRAPARLAALLAGPRARIRAWIATGRWKRPRSLLGAVVLLLLVGLGIGLAIPRGPDMGIALRAGESARRDVVLATNENFDPGSLVLLDRKGDALLWTATSARGEIRCLIIDVAPPPAAPPMESDCRRTDIFRDQPLQAVSQAPVRGGDPAADGSEAVETYAGYVLVSANGVPIGLLQRMEYYPQINRGLTDVEGLTAERIRSEQNLAHVALAARWRGLVIWLGFTTQNEQCLIVEDPTTRSSCADPNTATPNLDPQTGADGPMLSLDLYPSGDRPGARVEMWNPMFSAGYVVITERTSSLLVPEG